MKKRVDILNLWCRIPNKDVIKMILSLLNRVDWEMILMAHNKKRKLVPTSWIYKTNLSNIEHVTIIRCLVLERDVEMLRWLGLFNKRLCSIAAKNGDLDCLQWLRKNGCKWNTKKVCIYLSRGGHSTMLLWARARGCVWTKGCCTNAIRGGYSKTFRMLIENGCPCDYYKLFNIKKKTIPYCCR